ncbi:MAG: 2'-5' RNA ligase [Candidatus Moranbacteria bacterium RIFOXYB1_FULL_43_19]|nr:MAG: 2'-5' RNA ligase [Candidatus Moranbacteria bacterium RIFOXYB1_FULL_43_19]OGI34032.1 MAG: 2'-5' RNA ligase [Candidatus Moranbacteria bacterium RIFOXYC1_FULL_44_13]OGI37742.1 MAG: 2'-5' RNA ligase [Candidatus Moranbacteria bacterium RIFOXYD1_FULL_44_12]
MQKRLFVAISLPEDIKKRLFRFVEKEYRNLPVKWVRKENFHITLNFLGYILDENVLDICHSIEALAQNFQSFDLKFLGAELGPNSKAKKMIWIRGEKNKELSEFKYQLDKALGFFTREKKDFRPHITLGRIQKKEWKIISPPLKIEKNFEFSAPVSSIELFESKFEKGKRVYYVLESFSLR